MIVSEPTYEVLDQAPPIAPYALLAIESEAAAGAVNVERAPG